MRYRRYWVSFCISILLAAAFFLCSGSAYAGELPSGSDATLEPQAVTDTVAPSLPASDDVQGEDSVPANAVSDEQQPDDPADDDVIDDEIPAPAQPLPAETPDTNDTPAPANQPADEEVLPDEPDTPDAPAAAVISGTDEPAPVSIETEPVDAPPENGWYDNDGVTLYYADGSPVTGFRTIDGAIYYFGGDGALLDTEGWNTVDGKRIYIRGGQLVTGIVRIGKDVMLFDESGVFTAYNGEYTFTDPARGTTDKYLFKDGVAAAGKTTVGSNEVLYDSLGRLVSEDGWKTILDPAGGEKTYYVYNGRLASGFVPLDGELTYFQSGIASTANGLQKISGATYYLENGCVRTGMIYVGSNLYFFDPANGGQMKTGWLKLFDSSYYAESTGIIKRSGIFAAGTNFYISDQNGALRYGWIKLGDYYYYTGSDGVMRRNTTVDGYKLDGSGKRIDIYSVTLAAVAKAAPSGSNADKLKACFNWLVKNCSYKRDYTDPLTLSGNWREQYAMEMLQNHQGNCYRYACAFAYMAEALGYDASVMVGRVSAVGGGTTPHAYTQIKINGVTYICDANLQSTRPSLNWYMLKQSGYHYYFVKVKSFDVTLPKN